ncbi:MAG: M23 family metallopeptidase [Candidatus Omnitrophota bacterium]|nr:M23 family metallopeptidase [Candidatus Omnitrophota bacterium]
MRWPLWIGMALGSGLTVAALELPYVNWRRIAPPLEVSPLIIRRDAKGDGRFLAPRSGRRRHRGVDMTAALNSPVRSIRSGRVVEVGLHRGLGRFVEVEHRHGLRSRYAHLSKVVVAVGSRVPQGALIGRVGKTGNARSAQIQPHLHLELLRDGKPIDPQALGLRLIDPAAPVQPPSAGRAWALPTGSAQDRQPPPEAADAGG